MVKNRVLTVRFDPKEYEIHALTAHHKGLSISDHVRDCLRRDANRVKAQQASEGRIPRMRKEVS